MQAARLIDGSGPCHSPPGTGARPHADFLTIMLQKTSSDPWTPEDHLIIAFDANSLGGTRTANLAPGVQFARPVEYALRYAARA